MGEAEGCSGRLRGNRRRLDDATGIWRWMKEFRRKVGAGGGVCKMMEEV